MWTSQVYGHHDKIARTKHTEHQKTRSIQITIFCVLQIVLDFLFSIFNYLQDFSKTMLNYRIGTVNEKHWGFKLFFRCSKPHTFSTFSGEEKGKKMSIHSFKQGHKFMSNVTTIDFLLQMQ